MKEIKDKFSNQAAVYKKARPTYPKALFDLVLNATKSRGVCWDCATGNGQVAAVLAAHFSEVYATDLSEKQLAQAEQKTNIKYSVMLAEQTSFPDKMFDLITVGQAMHWFDFDAFNKEAKRVLKDDGTICVWGYGPLGMEGEVGERIKFFYKEVIGTYWDAERNHIDEAYANVTFDFENVELVNDLKIEVDWTIEALAGYFNSWSSVQNYIAKHGETPVPAMMEEIKKVWGSASTKTAVLPLFLKVGKKRSLELFKNA